MLRDTLGLDRAPIFLVDGSSFLYRAFYAYPDLKTADGFPTNALYILLRILMKIIREEHPEYMYFFLDGKGPNFRHELFSEYKANREKMPEDLSVQIQPILEAVKYLGVPSLVPEGVEADDCIAGVCNRFKSEYPVVIVGSDKDLYQCLDDGVFLWDPGKKNGNVFVANNLQEKQGVAPEQWPDYQALVGDSSDNIPGVPGIGPKTAVKIMRTCPTLEDIRDNFSRLGKAEKRKLEPYLEEMFLYRRLTALSKEACSEMRIQDLKLRPVKREALRNFFKSYELRSFLKEMEEGEDTAEKQESPEKKERGELKDPSGFSGKDIGLVQEEEGLVLAVDGGEWLYRGEVGKLALALEEAMVFVPGYKKLLRDCPQLNTVPADRCFDLLLAAYLLNPEEGDFSWERLKENHLPALGVHPENNALGCLALGREMRENIRRVNLKDLMCNLEMPLIPVLESMERKGVCIDLQSFREFLQEVRKELDGLEEKIHRLAGVEFNVRSHQQLAEVLFERLGLAVRQKTPGGAPSTSSQVLENMRGDHEIIELVLRYRTLEKLRSTYLDPLPRKVDAQGRLHTHFNNMATATGRLSSSDPNVQNIPIKGEFGTRMRACFVAERGNMLVGADYSQIELRLLAHMSADPELTEAFARDEDIHSRTAALLWDKGPEEVTREERRKAKTVNFGLIYGMGPQKLSRELGININEAKGFMDKYFRRLGGVADFYARVENLAREKGYVSTIAGRRRLLPAINSRNSNLAQQARRMAINTVVQGSAADIIKQAMLNVYNDASLRRMGAELILQVHDELLLEAPQKRAEEAGEILARLMGGAWDISVPLAVDWGVAWDWSRAHSG